MNEFRVNRKSESVAYYSVIAAAGALFGVFVFNAITVCQYFGGGYQ